MKKTSLLLCALQLIPLSAKGGEPIGFVAQVENEALAEEAILLLHCLAARSNTSWEFSGETRGKHWLKVLEKDSTLQGTYQRNESKKTFILKQGESDEACDTLEPPTQAMKSVEALSEPTLSSSNEDFSETSKSRTWLWVGLGAATIAGFFYWKSKQPSHRGVELHDSY